MTTKAAATSPAGAPLAMKFDRGTILFEYRDDLASVVARLPGVLWDARVKAFRAPAYRHESLQRDLTAQAIAVESRVQALLPATAGWADSSLRPYQAEALAAWERACARGLVVLPTGSGKTRVAIGAMAQTKLSTLCLVPTRVLLDQWHAALGVAYPKTIGRLGDGHHELAQVTISTFESAFRQMPQIGNRFGLLVVDEAHHFGNGLRDEALEMCTAPARLGLTATPSASMERLSELIGGVVYGLAIGDLAGGFLSDFETVVMNLDLDPGERRAYEAELNTFRNYRSLSERSMPGATWEEFARGAARTDEGRRALAAWRSLRRRIAFTKAKAEAVSTLLSRHRDARVIVFTADNETAYAVARRHLIMPITCHIGRRERETALTRFRSGELRALVSARVLNEGLDVPDAEVAIVVGGTLGNREHVQRVGRLLRPAPGKRARVYELVSRGTIEVRQAERRREALGSPTAAAL